jgi:hypothetical protein
VALREIHLDLPNRPGALARVARLLAKEQINVAAISVDSSEGKGRVRLVVSDPDRAVTLLAQGGYTLEEREMLVVRLEDRSGSFLRVLEALAREKVNIQSVALLVAREDGRALVGLSTNDPVKSRRLLQKAGLISPSAERLVTNSDLVAAAPSIPSESVGMLM